MGCYVLGFQEIDQTQVAVVGGKGANLGELSRIEGIRVPAGYCVTTEAFRRIMADAPSIDDRLGRLSRLQPDDRDLRLVDLLEIQHVAAHPLPPLCVLKRVSQGIMRHDPGLAASPRCAPY